MSAWAIVPAKSFARSKTRLSPALAPSARAGLARALLEGVIRTLSAARGIAAVTVLTDGDEVARFAAALGARALRDPPAGTLSAVVDAGLGDAARHGASAALVCMADLAYPTVGEIEQVLAALAEAPVVAVPDPTGHGTSVLALRPPRALASCFGHPDSLGRHRAAASARGLGFAVLGSESLAFDVDTPADLASWRRARISASPAAARG